MSSDPAGEWPIAVRRHPQAKHMRLRLDPRARRVLLTIPRRTSERRALAWAAEQRGWIEAAIANLGPAKTGLQPGSTIPLYGEPHLIDWREDAPRTVRPEKGRLVVGGPADLVERRVLRWLRAHALERLEAETRAIADKAGVKVDRVGVGDPVSRWGSCSSSGAIRYSWRLILAPDSVRLATVAHEVAHRVHMNHGPAFHALVARLHGEDPQAARLWLRRHGASLHRVGL